jgi:hypothetical protein
MLVREVVENFFLDNRLMKIHKNDYSDIIESNFFGTENLVAFQMKKQNPVASASELLRDC